MPQSHRIICAGGWDSGHSCNSVPLTPSYRMRKLYLLTLLVLGGCMLPRPSALVVPADSTRHGGHEFESLALAAVVALILIPALAKKKP